MEKDKIKFIEAKIAEKTIEKTAPQQVRPDFGKNASNPIKAGLMKFVHSKEKFDLKDLP